jgi:Lrp/AsnC family leucine-responsive transcriptional regulator
MFMDALDQRILDCLQRDARVTNQSLADKVGLSPSACLKRVKRLHDSGIIDRVVALLNPEAIGKSLYFVVEVTMERDQKRLYKRFEDRALAASEVKQCYQVTGECDFVLIVAVPDMDAYDSFCDSILYADDNLRKFRTLVSRKRSKFDTSATLALET